MASLKKGKWTHRYVLGQRVSVERGAPGPRVIFEEQRPSGTPDQRGTVIELGVPSDPGVDDTREMVGQRQTPPPKPAPCRKYIVLGAVKNVTSNTVRYRVVEALPDTADLNHSHIVAAVRKAPHQVATLLKELLGSTYAVAGAIGVVAPERET